MTSQAVFTCCVCFAENMMRMYQQFPRTWYVSPYGLFFSFALLSGGLFFNHKIVHGLPSPPFSHPEFLKFWCSRNETALSVSNYGNQMWGYALAEDASVWGLRKSKDASQPVNL